MLRQTLWKIAEFQKGDCITCGESRGDSPYKRLCTKCGVKKRVQNQKRYGHTPWFPGSRGKPPKWKKSFVVKKIVKGKVVKEEKYDGRKKEE